MKAKCRCVIGGLCLKQMSTSFRCSDSCRRMVEDNPHRWTIYKNYGDKPKEDNVKKKTDQVDNNEHVCASSPIHNRNFIINSVSVGNTTYENYRTLESFSAELSDRLYYTFTCPNTVGTVSGLESTSSGGM